MSKIPQQRKVIYYIGMGLLILGFILFISVFFSVFSYMDSNIMAYGKEPSFGNAILGMLFMIVGSIVMNVGARGAAGSGVILKVIKIKCRNCGSLNEEDAKFCKNCGIQI